MSNRFDRKKILNMIKNKQISPEEALKLFKEFRKESAFNFESVLNYYGCQWQRCELNEANRQYKSQWFNGEEDCAIVFDYDNNFRDNFRERLEGLILGKSKVILIKPSDTYKVENDDIYNIDPKKHDDYRRLLRDINSQDLMPNKIIYFWTKDDFEISGEPVAPQLYKNIFTLFNLTRGLMECKPRVNIEIMYLYCNNNKEVQPHHGAIDSFFRTVNLENPRFHHRVIEIDRSLMEENTLVDLFIKEFEIGDGVSVRYSEGKRFIKEFKSFNLSRSEYRKSNPEQGLLLKEDGVYLITGGMGGLGIVFARYLAQKVKAKIVLTGRSELDIVKKKHLKEIESLGSKAIYIKADISKTKATKELIAKIKTRFNDLNGIIHCAGVIKDTLIINKTQQDISMVLDPKVLGTINLDNAAKNEKLDFFILFSSIAAVLGNTGQCDYAYANGFMDNYSQHRELLRQKGKRYGKTLSINWPFFKDGGMNINEHTKKWMTDVKGIIPLTKERGIEALKKAFTINSHQIIILDGDKKKIDILMKDQGSGTKEESQSMASEVKDLSTEACVDVDKDVERYLKNLLCTEIKLPVSKIASKDDLDKYGIDSIMIMNLTRKLELEFGDLPKTLFFEYRTIEELSGYFLDNHRRKLIDKFTSPSQTLEKKIKKARKRETKQKWNNRFRQYKKLDEQSWIKNNNTIDSTIEDRDNEPCCTNRYRRDIAVIGISGRYPKAENIEELWENLQGGIDCITEIPKDRWDYRKYYSPNKEVKGKTRSKWGGFIDDVDKFDSLFFNISPKDAKFMDPQERIFLETTWHALEDAGYKKRDIYNKRVGVFAGVMYGHYQLFGVNMDRESSGIPSSSYASIANRVSYFLNLKGPSMSVDTMCSSSLTAIHLACESINNGECDIAIVGGVNLTIHPNKYVQLSYGRFASSDGRCRSFGEGGDGYVPGEGVGVAILKPLPNAIKDMDNIYGVIKGSTINHGGKTNGYTVPSPDAQGELIGEALSKTGIDPRSISYIEAHGTGTALGDPIEIRGLVKAFGEDRKEKKFCAIGSVKSNVGHLEAAAGIVALTKVLLQMKHKQLVPSIHSEKLNPNIDFSKSPFYVQRKLTPWEEPITMENGIENSLPRRAGISSFGAGGSNAHVIVEEYVYNEDKDQTRSNGPELFIFSAKNKERLKAYGLRFLKFLEGWGRTGKVEFKPNKAKDRLKADLLIIISNTIGVSTKDIDPCENINDYGIEPINLTEIVEKIYEKYNILIDLGVFTENYTLDLLIKYILRFYNDAIVRYYSMEAYNYRDTKDSLSLLNMAYTLQVGREPMEEGLAIIASSVHELKEYLSNYCRDEKNIGNMYSGSRKNDEGLLISLIGGRDKEKLIEDLIKDRDLSVLAQLWVAGMDIDWKPLFKGLRSRRISLPKYPFAKRRCWVDMGLEKPFQEIVKDSKEEGIISMEKNELERIAQNYAGDEIELKIIDGNIALVIIKDKKNKNMFSEGVITGLMAKFAEIRANKDIKVAVVTGYDNVFCMGGTQHQLLGIADKKVRFSDAPFLYKGLLETEIPVISAIQGHASGGGLLFGLYGDIIVMSEDSIYSAVFTKYGFTPGMGATLILRERFGGSLSTEMMFTAKSYKGEELKRRGSSILFAKRSKVLDEALQLARSLGQKPINTLKTLKKELSSRILKELPRVIQREEEMHLKTFSDPEVKGRINHYFIKSNSDQPKSRDKDKTIDIKGKSSKVGLKLKARVEDIEESKINLKSIVKHEENLDYDEEYINDKIKEIIANVIFIHKDELDNDTNFKDIGVDSISGVEIIRDLNKEFNLNMDAVDLYDYFTVNNLSQYIHGQSIKNYTVIQELDKSSISNNINYEHNLNLKEKNLKNYDKIKSFDDIDMKERNFSKESNKAIIDVEAIIEKVKDILKGILYVEDRDLQMDLSFKDMGVDSVSGIEIIRDLNTEFKLNMDAVILYDYSTINSLSSYIHKEIMKQIKVFEEIKDSSAKNTIHIETLGETDYMTDFNKSYKNEAQIKSNSYTQTIPTKIQLKDHNNREKLKSLLAKEERIVKDSISLSEKKDEDRFNVKDEIAIIGVSGRFPGAKNVDEFWENLKNGVDSIIEIPKNRWDIERYYSDDSKVPNTTYCKWGGFIDDVDKFNCEFFNITPMEAEMMDPQQRLILEETWRVIEDAGYSPDAMSNSKCGVFIGAGPGDYNSLEIETNSNLNGLTFVGSSNSILAGRISYFFNLKGPNMVIDTACSSSLIAINEAYKSIITGESEIAIAGGVAILTTPALHIMTSKSGMLSKDGKCKTFDNGANGFVPGEGIGMVILKPLKRAVEDNDFVYGVIKGTSVNQDGRTNGITAPSVESQENLELELYEKFNIHPEAIGYIEAHGTGTKLGDPIEVKALKKSFEKYTNNREYCAIGSVKTNIGHGLSAAGVFGFIKGLLCLRYKKLVPSLNFNKPNEHIDFENSPFYVNTILKDWQVDSGKSRLAAVSSFGFSGTNAHIVLEEAPKDYFHDSSPSKPYHIIPLSAKNEKELLGRIEDLRKWIDKRDSDTNLGNMGYTLLMGRKHFNVRLAIVAHDMKELKEIIEGILDKGIEKYDLTYNGLKNKPKLDPVFKEFGDRLILELKDSEALNNEEYRNKVLALADLYVKGYSLRWNNLYPSNEYNRIPMPTYRFMGKRYWNKAKKDLNEKQECYNDSSQSVENIILTKKDRNTEWNVNEGVEESIDKRTLKYVKSIFSEITKIDSDEIDSNSTFECYGVDSLIGLEIIKRFEQDFGDLEQTLLYENLTIDEVTRYFLDEHLDRLKEIFYAYSTTTYSETALSLEEEKDIDDKYSSNDYKGFSDNDDIAIIGMSCRYPLADNVEEYWENLKKGRDCITEIPINRWDYRKYYDKAEGKICSKWGGFINNVDKFDPLFFNIPPIEAEIMDPQERLFLQEVWLALEDAGYTKRELREAIEYKKNSDIGVFAGCTTYTYQLLGLKDSYDENVDLPSSIPWTIANRVSYLFNFHGPSMPVDTACSSSLTAVHLACESLRKGECKTAIVGGVNLYLHPSKYYLMSKNGMLSPTGKCSAFGKDANGIVPGEGIGVVILKPKKLAIKNGDNIYALIKSTAINHGGKTSGYSVPNPNAQANLIEDALQKAQIDPRTMSYIEAQGTGTELGDTIEIKGLTKAFKKYTNDLQYCAIGSSKPNIGHLEATSGISGLMKLVLQMKYRLLVPSIHAEELNPKINFANSPFYVQKTLEKWKKPIVIENGEKKIYPRRGGVSSFGAGGANAHVIIEEFEREEKRDVCKRRDESNAILLSAKNNQELNKYAKNLLDYLTKNTLSGSQDNEISLDDIAYTLQVGREAMVARLAIVASSKDELMDKLSQYLKTKSRTLGVYTGNVRKNDNKDYPKEQLNKWLEEREMSLISEKWVQGVEIDWKELYKDSSPRRVSLPGYPFRGESYWIERELNRKEDMETLFYSMEWNKKPIEEVLEIEEHKLTTAKRIILFDIDNRLKDALEDVFESQSKERTEVILVKPGKSYSYDGKSTYIIDPDKDVDYRALFHNLRERNELPLEIIHLWSKDKYTDNIEELNRQLSLGLYSLLHITQSLIKERIKDNVRLVSIYLEEGDEYKPQYGALSSFIRTVRLENPKYLYKIMRLVDREIEYKNLAKLLLREMNYDSDLEISYDRNNRYVKILNENPKDEGLIGKDSKLRHKGVYLITGGFGGLGKIFARYLAEKFKAKLALTGRSGLNKEKKSFIQELKELGAEVEYIQADISMKRDVELLIEETRNRFGGINGILHGAGLIRDSYVLRKSVAVVDEVLAPKQRGTIYLDAATKHEKLDFFVMFSSIASVMGSIGQCDYAYANGFIDHYAKMRESLRETGMRFGKTLSINWPLWKDGGMSMPDEVFNAYRNESGIDKLPTHEGLKAFEMALNMTSTQSIVLYGFSNKIREVLHRQNQIPRYNGEQNRKLEHNIIDIDKDRNLLYEKAEELLKQRFCDLIKLPIEKMDSDVRFEEYGVDSILIKKFNAQMEKDFGVLSKTLLFEYQNLQELVEYFVENHYDKLSNWFDIRGVDEIKNRKNTENTYSKFLVPRGSKGVTKDTNIEYRDCDIAVIGMSGCYPKAENLEEFWQNLKSGDDCITTIPSERWDYNQYFDPNPKEAANGKMYCKWGGFISHVDKFDPLFFGISPREAELVDPQERLFLQSSWNVLEDAGYTRQQIKDMIKRKKSADVGVFVGVTTNTYLLLGPEQWSKGNKAIPASFPWSIANRVSYLFNFNGPSMPIDTACSSSLAAIYMACESIKRGECSMAIAGGVNLYLHPSKYVQLCLMRMLSPRGRCHSFGKDGDGFVPGEGVGAILLKPLKDAVEDEDNIYGVIKGGSINHGGHTNGYTVPSPKAQSNLILEAVRRSNVNPSSISYVEAHGTGTSLGDPIEIDGLSRAFNNYTSQKQYCAIGSVKSNIGHLESAAGIAGLTKILLQFRHKQLVPSIHSKSLNEDIDFKNSPFYVQQTLSEWKPTIIEEGSKERSYPRRACISSFGAGGVNVHIVLEEYKEDNSDSTYEEVDSYAKEDQLIVLSAKTEEGLNEYSRKLFEAIDRKSKSYHSGDENKILIQIQEDIRGIVAEAVYIPEAEIDMDVDIVEYGFDPVTLTDLKDKINQYYNIELKEEALLKYISIQSLSAELYNNFRDRMLKFYCGENSDTDSVSELSLADIAYTLQVGREAMEYRIAIKASSIEELKDILKEYCKGNVDIPNLYKGYVKKKRGKASRKSEGIKEQEDIAKIISERNISSIGELWVSGNQIEWSSLYNRSKPKRVSLPTYPFAKERCWIEIKENNIIKEKNPVHKKSLHPLIQSNESTLEEQRFKGILTGEEFFIRDHIVDGNMMMPGVAYLEMARAAGELSYKKSRIRKLKNIIWIKPIELKDASKEIYISLYPDDGTVKYTISNGLESNQSSIYAQGNLVYENQMKETIEDSTLDIERIKKGCLEEIDGSYMYSLFERGGLKYGNSFRPIQTLYNCENEALSYMKLPKQQANKDFKKFGLHPSLMDGALQTIMGLLGSGEEKESVMYLPFSIGEVQLIRPLTDECYGYAVSLESKKGNSKKQIKSFDIQLVDIRGRILVRIKDFMVRTFPKKTDSPILQKFYLSTIWKEELVEQGKLKIDQNQPILVFDNDYKLCTTLKTMGINTVLIKPATSYKALDNNVYEINPQEEGDYERLIEELDRKKLLSPKIIHMWSKENFSFNLQFIDSALNLGLYSLVYLSRTIMKYNPKMRVKLLYLYLGHQDKPQPYYEAVEGFVKTIIQENPKFLYRVIGLDKDSYMAISRRDKEIVKLLMREFNGDKSIQILYRGGRRFAKYFEEIDINSVKEKVKLLKRKGTYLITGGTGGLGFIFAEFLAKEYKANIVLTGRSELTNEKQQRIYKLKELGADILYIKADISKYDDVNRLMKNIKSKFKSLDGLIHSAGATCDSLIINKKSEEFKAVLEPKVNGSILLDFFTRDEELDFFVMFSSVASVLGNRGQSDYAYANSFMDYFSEFREDLRGSGKRKGKTISINWGLWKDGGMKVDEHTRQMMDTLAGMIPISTDTGIQAFVEALALDHHQLIVLEGKEKIRSLLL